MKPDRATAIMALIEASRGLELAHRALVRLGDAERAAETEDMGADVAALIGEIQAQREPRAEALS